MMQIESRSGPSPNVSRRPGGRSARVRRAVFDATLAILASEGYHALSIEAVAAAAGVNKTTVYRNWPTKSALVRAAAEDRSAALITTEITGEAERDLVAFVKSVAANVTSPIGRALVIATLNDPAAVSHQRTEFWRHRFENARDLVRSATGFEGDEADRFTERLIAPVYLRAFITGAPIDQAFIRDSVRSTLRLAAAEGRP